MAQYDSAWRPAMAANYAQQAPQKSFGQGMNEFGGGLVNPVQGVDFSNIGALLQALLPQIMGGARGNPRVAKPSHAGVPQRLAAPISHSIPQPSRRIAVPAIGPFHHNASVGNGRAASRRTELLNARRDHIMDVQQQARGMASLMSKARARGYNF